MPSKPSSKETEPKFVDVSMLRDGVFVAEDVRKDKGEKAFVPADIAKVLIDNGHAKPL